eukprot:117757_1
MSSKSKSKKHRHTTKPITPAEKRRQVRNPKTGRKKTSIACQHCWKSKTRCGIKRPCDRCVRLGHKDCHDRPEATRKRQHIKRKDTTKATSSTSLPMDVAIPPIPYTFSANSGYVANSELPPVVSIPSDLLNSLIAPLGSSSDTSTTNTNLFPSILDPNFGANTVQNLRISEVMADVSHIQSRKKQSKNRKKQRDKKRKKHKRKKHNRKARNISDEPPLKRRKKNFRDDDSSGGHQADDDENIYCDPFSDSSHYSTEYPEDDDDPSLAVIISVQLNDTKPVQFQDTNHTTSKDTSTDDHRCGEVWSHYTFTRGHLSKFISVDDSKLKRSRIPFTEMVSSPSINSTSPVTSPSQPASLDQSMYQDAVKKESSIDQDLAAILAPVGMLKKKECPSLPPLLKAIPMNNIFTTRRNVKLCQTIPNWTLPPLPTFEISSRASMTRTSPLNNAFALPGGCAPTIARITSLIPAPATNMSIN